MLFLTIPLIPPALIALGEAVAVVSAAIVTAVVVNESGKAISNAMSNAEDKAKEKEKSGTDPDVCKECEKEADDAHDNIDDLEGKEFDEVEKELDDKLRDKGGWTKKPLKSGEGSRYNSPDGNRQVRINKGYPKGNHKGPSDPIHSGPYVSTPSNGKRIPLKGNPSLD